MVQRSIKKVSSDGSSKIKVENGDGSSSEYRLFHNGDAVRGRDIPQYLLSMLQEESKPFVMGFYYNAEGKLVHCEIIVWPSDYNRCRSYISEQYRSLVTAAQENELTS